MVISPLVRRSSPNLHTPVPSTTCEATLSPLPWQGDCLFSKRDTGSPMNAFLNSPLLPKAADRHLIRNACKHGGSAGGRRSTTPKSAKAPSSRIARKDWNLIQQALRGDSRAQHELFATHAARLHRTAYAVLRNKEDAEDAVQNSLCNAFINLRSFKGRSSFFTWLTRIVINSALMIRRRRTAHAQTSLDEMMDNQPERLQHRIVYPGPNPEQICASSLAHQLLSDHTRQLPPAIRDAFQLYFLKGLSAADTCQALGIGNAALKARIFRARRMLEDALRPPMRHDQTRKTWSIHPMAAAGSSTKHSDTPN
jgi:RNA polymerase sigma-70 factor, ECF subfamily